MTVEQLVARVYRELSQPHLLLCHPFSSLLRSFGFCHHFSRTTVLLACQHGLRDRHRCPRCRRRRTPSPSFQSPAVKPGFDRPPFWAPQTTISWSGLLATTRSCVGRVGEFQGGHSDLHHCKAPRRNIVNALSYTAGGRTCHSCAHTSRLSGPFSYRLTHASRDYIMGNKAHCAHVPGGGALVVETCEIAQPH